MMLSKQTITDLTGWIGILEAAHPGPWSHSVKESLRLVTISDANSRPIIVLPVTDVSMLLANLQPKTLLELVRGYMLYKSSMTTTRAPLMDTRTTRGRRMLRPIKREGNNDNAHQLPSHRRPVAGRQGHHTTG